MQIIMQISFPILEILLKKCVAHPKSNLFCSCMNVKDLFLNFWQMLHCITTGFAGKLLVIQFYKVCNYCFLQQLFQQKMIFIKFLLNVVAIFSKWNIMVQLFSRVKLSKNEMLPCNYKQISLFNII